MNDEMNGEREALGLSLEQRGGVWVVQFAEGGCRPASIVEVNLWQALQAGRASLAANAGGEPVAYCFAEELQSATENGDVFDAWTKESTGAMPLYAHPSHQAAQQAPAETMTLQEIWVAAGGNPGNTPTRDDVLLALKTLDEVCDEATAQQAPAGATAIGLQEQHDRDSRELRSLCESRDQARRERDECKAEIAGLEASCSTMGRLIDSLRLDNERLDWVLRRCSGTWLRAYLGVASDTGDMNELRVLIDANRGAAPAAPSTPASSGWISVDERLPPSARPVLACNPCGFIGRAEFSSGRWNHIGKPSHWMPLPPLPASPTIEGESK